MKIQVTLGLAVAGLFFATGSSAQDSAQDNAQAGTLEEVIVTAEKREQSMQEVPLSITNFSGEAINPAGISGLYDISLKTPNLTITTFNIGEPQLFLRGAGGTLDSAGSDPTVSVFIDEVYIGRTGASSFDLYDLERVEVLRGPQGTLYGRNVTGGAISLYTQKPREEFESKFGVTAGNYGLTVFRGYVNGALSDNVFAKFTVSKTDRNGYADNIDNGQDLEDADNLSARTQILFRPSDATEVLFGLDYSTDDTNGQCRNLTNFDRGDQDFGGVFVPFEIAAVAAEGVGDPRECGMKLFQFANKDIFGAMLHVTHDFGWANLTSITAYREADYEWLQELVGADAPPSLISVEDNEGENSDQVTQEFRLSGSGDNLDWVVGVFALRENVDRFANQPILFGPVPGFPLAGVLLDRRFKQNNTSKSKAIFGQFTWGFTDTLDLTLGGRYTRDDKDIDQFYTQNGAVVYDITGANENWSRFTPRASLDWKINDDKMLYFTYSEGYKSGVFISQSVSALAAADTLAPEDATNYEVGAKTEWLNNRLRFNLTYFDFEVKNLQLFRLVDFVLFSENTDANVSGFESDFVWAASDNFTLSGTLSTLDAKYKGGTFDGNDMVRSPDLKWSLNANYQQPLQGGATLNLNVGAAHSGAFFFEALNTDVSRTKSYEAWDASVKYVNKGGDWDLTAWGKNLSDELIVKHGIDGSFGGQTQLYEAPRTWGVTFNYYIK